MIDKPSRAIKCPRCKFMLIEHPMRPGVIPDHDCDTNMRMNDVYDEPKKIPEKEFVIIKLGYWSAMNVIRNEKKDYDIEIISTQGFQDQDVIIVTYWRTKK